MQTFKINFTQQQLQIINTALGEIPHKFAGPLIQEINEQLKAQMEPTPEPPDAVPAGSLIAE
jgi:hypothetical protein